MSATYELAWAGCWAYVLHSKGEGGVFKKQGSSAPSWLCDFSIQLKSLTHLSLPQFPHLQSRDGGGTCLPATVGFKGVVS